MSTKTNKRKHTSPFPIFEEVYQEMRPPLTPSTRAVPRQRCVTTVLWASEVNPVLVLPTVLPQPEDILDEIDGAL